MRALYAKARGARVCSVSGRDETAAYAKPKAHARRGVLRSMWCAHWAWAGAGRAAVAVVGNPDAGAERLIRLADAEADADGKLELLEAAIDAEPSRPLLARALLLKGNAYATSGKFREAQEDFTAAASTLRGVGVGIDEALALDGLGLCLMQLSDHEGAEDAFNKAIASAGASGCGSADVPTYALVSGLRGGAATVYQRLDLHRALAQAAAGASPALAVASFERIDKGPNPDGFPQFWEARAALVAALWRSGARSRAELEWASLCEPAPTPPPSTPTNQLYAGVNRAAQLLLRVEGAFTDTACEDYQTGVFIPCDDAGIPGLGGSNSPCGTYFQLSHGIPTRAPQLRRSGERPRRNSDCTLPS